MYLLSSICYNVIVNTYFSQRVLPSNISNKIDWTHVQSFSVYESNLRSILISSQIRLMFYNLSRASY